MFQIIDNQTGYVVATRSTRKAARRKADQLDMEYGAVRYTVRSI